MSTLLKDVRYALRMLWKQPGFTAVAVLAIALGIGANTTIFSTVDVLLLRPFAFHEPERVLLVWERNPQSGFSRGSVAPANFLDLRAQVSTLEDLSAYRDSSFNMSEGDAPERVEGSTVSASLFRAVEGRAALGRLFTEEEEQPGRDAVVVISHGLWQRRFGGDPQIVNRRITLDGEPHTVVGVMRERFNFPPNSGDVWKPLSFDAEESRDRGNHFLRVLGRLKDGATVEQAEAELSTIGRQLEQQYPDTNAGRDFRPESIIANYTRGPRPFLLVLLGAVGFVLLLACANVANLLLVRGAARQKEIAIRMALGAGRFRLVRQLLTESVVLAVLGGALGSLLAVWGIALTSRGIPQSLAKYLPGWENMGVNPRALLFTLGVSVLTGLVFGLAPALQATRLNFNESLKEGGRTSGGHARNRLRSMLVVAEITLSLVLLVGAGLMIRSFVELARVEPGFDPTNVVAMDLSLAEDRYKEPRTRAEFYRQLLGRLEALPGVQKAGAAGLLPLSRYNNSSSFTVEGRPPLPKGQQTHAEWRSTSPSYLEAMNIPLRRGRYLTERDNSEDAPRVVLINEAMARKFFAGEDPLGRRLDFGDAAKKGHWEIVGVVGDVRHEALEEAPQPEVYVAHAKSPWRSMSVVLRTANDPTQVVAAAQAELRALDPAQPLFNVRTLDRVVREAVAPKKVATGMMAVFALIALALAAIGLYAVMSYSVTQRTHEIGVRMALGAEPRDILRLVVRQGMILTSVGLAIGLVASLVLTQGMSKVLYGVSATDPVTFGGISLLLAAVAFAANYFPARRATRVDPMDALRYE
ncbi:MAG TPA: ABC transporter permease [Pyrinomonadaceae bacterium]|nr:ABC transporter permease [Pyrinomonadaceae bacterium]